MERFTTYDEIIAMDWEEVTQEQAEEMLGRGCVGCPHAGVCFGRGLFCGCCWWGCVWVVICELELELHSSSFLLTGHRFHIVKHESKKLLTNSRKSVIIYSERGRKVELK